MQLTKDMILDFDAFHRNYKVGTYHVSEIVLCHQKMFYRRVCPVAEPCNVRMALGKIFHNALPDIIKDPKLRYEVILSRNYTDFEIKGTADAVDEDNVYEFKFSRLRHISDRAICQANMYCGLSSRNTGTVFMVNPDTLNVISEPFEYDPINFQMMLSMLSELHIWLSRYPEKEPHLTHSPSFPKECDYCAYEDICSIKEGIL